MPRTTSDAPIGIFDSGFGGLTVARSVIDQLPHESIVYLGDTARQPYGSKPIGEVREYALECLDHLVPRVRAGNRSRRVQGSRRAADSQRAGEPACVGLQRCAPFHGNGLLECHYQGPPNGRNEGKAIYGHWPD